MSTITDLIAPKSTRTRRISAWLRFEEEIVTQIYGPRIVSILIDHPVSINIVGLAKTFAEDHNCAVSTETMQRWLNICGLTPVQQTEWQGLDEFSSNPPDLDADQALADACKV